MKTTASTLITEDNASITFNNALIMDYCVDEKELMAVVGAEKVKLFQKKIKQALAAYPEVYAITTMCENVQKESEERFNENVRLGETIDELKHELNKNAETVKQAKDAVNKIKSLEFEKQQLESKHEKELEKKAAEYTALADAYNELLEEYNGLIDDVTSSKGHIKAWRQSAYIKQLEAEVAKHRKGGNKPIEQERVQEIRELKQLGKTNYRIAKMVGVAEATVAKYLKNERK